MTLEELKARATAAEFTLIEKTESLALAAMDPVALKAAAKREVMAELNTRLDNIDSMHPHEIIRKIRSYLNS